MKLLARLVLAIGALTPLMASGDSAPRVVLATPGVGDGAIERYTIRFSQPMVPLGDPRAATPVDVKCPVPGEGRWVDQKTFVYAFARGLPGGLTCSLTLRDGLKSLKGYRVAGRGQFTVDSGGPVAKAVLPSRYGGEIAEDQIFLIGANLPPDPRSVAAHAYCAIDGLGEKVPVDIVKPAVTDQLIQALDPDRWEVRNFLSDAGIAEDLPSDKAERAKALAPVIGLKCRRPLPPGRDVSLVWGADIASASGRKAGATQRFDFTVRKPFTARFECSRVNPQAGCNPVQAAYVRFSAQVPKDMAMKALLRLPDGKTVSPTLDDDQKRRNTISDLTFDAPLPADATAKLELPGGLKDESGRTLANGERFPLDVQFDEAPPLVKFAAPFGILESAQGGVLPVTVRNVEPALQGRNFNALGKSLRITGSDGQVAEWLRKVEKAGDTKIRTEYRKGLAVHINETGAKPVLTGGNSAQFTVNLPAKGKDMQVVGIPLKKPGFYVVEFASPRLGQALLGRNAPRYVATAALVTDMAVHFKWGRAGSLVWVTSLEKGAPVGGATVRVTDSCTGKLLANGTTDGEGRMPIAKGLPEPETYGGCDYTSSPHPLMVSATHGQDYSFTLTTWDKGIQPYQFDLPYGYSAPDMVFHTVFDRALVRQGETIHMKHIVRLPVAAGMKLEPGFTGTLRLSHRGSDTQFDLPLTIAANGSGENAWTVPKGAPMGDYGLSVLDKDGKVRVWSDQSFKVDEYRLPTMKATITGPKAASVRPRLLPLSLYVGYLSGGGASKLPVEMRIGYFRDQFRSKRYPGFDFGGEPVQAGIQPLNGDGEVDRPDELPPTQTLPLTLNGDGTARTTVDVPQSIDTMTNMLVEMDYQDANGEVLTASKTIPIYPSAVHLGVKTDGWMMKADDLRLKFIAIDTDGKPVKNKKINVALYSREVLTARRRLIGGFYAYDNQRKTSRLKEGCTATTDSLGRAECKLDPGVSGEVYAVAETLDPNGNIARATTSVWLAGKDDWWFGGDNGDRMDVIPEKPEYAAGSKARFQVRMPFRSATALVTVEREGVLSSFVTHLKGNDPVIEVPMTGGYAPDVYVSVLAVRGRVGGWRLWLADLARRWHLPFFSQDVAKPTATVDLAKPAYRLGIAKVKVGWDAHRLNVAVQAGRERYSARDVAGVAFQVKRPDGTPAKDADVAFVAVDEALLQLAPNDSWDVLKAMMDDRPLSVLTATAQMQVVGKRHYGRKAVAAGGGGGGGDLSALNRQNFKPVLLWKGHVPLDARGIGRVRVPLSDALTSFRLVAIATDGANLFGTGDTTIRSAQDLSIYSGVPPLVRIGDSFAAGFTLRNGSDKPMKVTASVDLSPRIATGRPMTMTIPAGGAVPVAWNLTVPQGVTGLKWQVRAHSADGKAADQLSVTQQVVPAVPVETWAASLVRVGASPMTIAPPDGALPGRGSVDVRLSDTLAPPLAGVRDYMAAYPFTCFEQRLSTAVALGDRGKWRALAGDIPAYIDRDGLLRYFPSDRLSGSEALTAYVLSLTAEAGLTLPADPRARMVEAMKAVLDGRLRHESYGDIRLQKVAAYAALARQGAATADMVGQIGMTPADMPTATLADYITALAKTPGLANAAQLRASAEDELRKRLVYEGTRLDLSDKGHMAWWMMQSDDEAVIKAALAVLGRPGWQEDAPKMMVGVAQRQQRGHWDTTTANAWGTVVAGRFKQLYPAQKVAGATTASLAGQTLRRNWPLTGDARTISLNLPSKQARLGLSQSGGEAPWAFVSVKAAVPLTQPVNAGYRIAKKVTVVQAKTKGRLTRGDVVKVTITVRASAERSWVVISDPLPAGATVLGDLGGQSQMLADKADDSDGAWPSYVERGHDAWRAYYRWLPRGETTVSYVMRLNGAGTLHLPPTRVEAMYSPEIHADLPNRPMVVGQR